MDPPKEGFVFLILLFIYADSTSKWTLEKKVYFYFYFVLYLRRLNVQMDPEEEEGLVFFLSFFLTRTQRPNDHKKKF